MIFTNYKQEINKLLRNGFDLKKSGYGLLLLAVAISIKKQNPNIKTRTIYSILAIDTKNTQTSIVNNIQTAIKNSNNKFKELTNTQVITLLAQQ